jgi:hypothetical protein
LLIKYLVQKNRTKATISTLQIGSEISQQQKKFEITKVKKM